MQPRSAEKPLGSVPRPLPLLAGDTWCERSGMGYTCRFIERAHNFGGPLAEAGVSHVGRSQRTVWLNGPRMFILSGAVPQLKCWGSTCLVLTGPRGDCFLKLWGRLAGRGSSRKAVAAVTAC